MKVIIQRAMVAAIIISCVLLTFSNTGLTGGTIIDDWEDVKALCSDSYQR